MGFFVYLRINNQMFATMTANYDPRDYYNSYGQQPPGMPQPPYVPGVPQVVYVNNITPAPAPRNGVGTTGFVFSIIGLVLGWLPYVGWALWFVGFLLSFIGVFRRPRGLAIAGLILSFVDLIVIIYIVAIVGAALLGYNFWS